MDDKFTYDVSEEEDQEAEEMDDDGRQSEITAIFLSAVEGINNARKCIMSLHVETKIWLPSAVLTTTICCLAQRKDAATSLLESDLCLIFRSVLKYI